MKAGPYLDILKELGYFLLEDDIDTTFGDDTVSNEDLYCYYYPVYAKSKARVELHLEAPEKREVVYEFMNSKDPSMLNIVRIEAYYIDGEYDDLTDDSRKLIFYGTSTCIDDSGIQEISRVTPELFRDILKAKESADSEFKYSHKVLQRYLDAYYNIIIPIVNPIAKLKKLWPNSSIFRGFESENCNRNIEIDYYNKDWERRFTVGLDYITRKLYFYVNPGNPIIDFESAVTTKGKMLELLKEYEI